MRAEWSREFSERARRYWTEERTRALVGDKQLPLLPGTAPVLLRALGLLNRDASLPPTRVRKFRQINHMLLVVRPALRELAEQADPVRVVDAGCGRSYLGLLVAWWFTERAGRRIELLCIDRNPAIVDACRRRARAAGLDGSVAFAAADLAEADLDGLWGRHFRHRGPLDALLSLHACDVATDRAIALGVRHEARFIAVAPCCQAELAAAWAGLSASGARGAFRAVWEVPHLKRTVAASITDALRVLLLRAAGYHATATEFVEANHTPKNTLIRAIRRAPDPDALSAYRALVEATGGAEIALASLLGLSRG